MILQISIILVFSVIFGVSKSITDITESCFSISRLRYLNPLFWDKHQSWKNKWKNGNPKDGERFLGSSTLLVWITDAWHLFTGLSYMALSIAVAFTQSLFGVAFIFIPLVIGLLVFEASYRILKD